MATAAAPYDYIVVGAGSAGCVLANRLSDRAGSVLLLEAGGPDDRREIRIPAAFAELFRTGIDWAYETVPQAELNDRACYWPRGKTLGGSSSINAMIYMRGHPTDYDGWRDAGNEGWGFADLLPYFRRAEHGEPGAADHLGTGGPLHVTDLRSPNVLSETFVEAAVAAGHRRNEDFNDGPREGVGFYHVTQRAGKRHSAADAYLTPAMDRRTLDVETGAHVTGIRFDDNRAVGVTYEQSGARVAVDAEREVLLCGGAINSPQLLMLSGVGPADHLAGHDVDVVHDLPGVGRDLQDHLNVGVVYDCTRPVSIDDAGSLWDLAKFFLTGRGPLTSNVAEAGGFAKTDPALNRPDVQFHFGPAYFVDHGLAEPVGDHGFSLGVQLLRPESRGRIELRSADPFDHPAIDPRYLTAGDDLDVRLAGLKLAREILRAAPFDDYRGDPYYPKALAEDDGTVIEHIRETAGTLYHPVGTCRMGEDDAAVVDDHLQVHGLSGLRVVDASVMPTVPGGNTNAPTIAIAEKAADLIAGR